MLCMMSQQGFGPPISFRPDLTENSLAVATACLLRPGDIMDRVLASYCCRLEELFQVFVSTCPAPEWAAGLHLTAEMCHQYELYLPMSEIKKALAALCRRACLYEPCYAATHLSQELSWPETLERLQPFPAIFSPGRFLHELATSERYRLAFLSALFIPKSFGGSFRRYPLQSEFLCRWLSGRGGRVAGKVAVLDTACGSGEGVYEVAEMLLQLGFTPCSALVEGSTLEPLELIAAAFGWYPHDRHRAAIFRERVRPVLAAGGAGMIRFYQDDVCQPREIDSRYDVILCNGLLGGPLLHGEAALAMVINRLAKRLNPGGIILAADHFHGGWQKKTPPAAIEKLLAASGLDCLAVGEGVGAVRIG